MGPDIFNLVLSSWLFLIFGTVCVMSMLFTFSLRTYLKIEEKLNFCIFSDRILTPLDRSIDFVNIWLMGHNKIVGVFLVLLSLIDLKLAFGIVNML